MGDKFRNKNGEHSVYALHCGYIQRHEIGNLRLDLWHEGACYHVRQHEFFGNGRILWESHEQLTPMRKLFRKIKKEMNNV